MDRLDELGVDETQDPKKLFDIKQVIGKGSYGSVFKALDKKTAEFVALKQVIFEADDDLEDIVNEVRILKDCHNKNIIQYHGSYIDKSDNSLWIAMELCDYGSISDIMQNAHRTLTEQECIYVIKGMLEGLEYLHERNVLHRDIKGNNILIGRDGGIRLADFGVSAQATMSGRSTVIGTPYWMAPEVIRGLQYNTPADVWSCGITIIELMTGLPPLADLHPMRAMFLIPSSKPPTLTDKVKHSKALDELLSCMLKKDPKQRSTVTELLHMIKKYPLPPVSLESLFAEAERNKLENSKNASGGYDEDEDEYPNVTQDGVDAASLGSFGATVKVMDTVRTNPVGDADEDDEDDMQKNFFYGGTTKVAPSPGKDGAEPKQDVSSVFNDISYFTMTTNEVEPGSLADTIIRNTIAKHPKKNGTVLVKKNASPEPSKKNGNKSDKILTVLDVPIPTPEQLQLVDISDLNKARRKLKKLMKAYKTELDRRDNALTSMNDLM